MEENRGKGHWDPNLLEYQPFAGCMDGRFSSDHLEFNLMGIASLFIYSNRALVVHHPGEALRLATKAVGSLSP